MGLRAAAAPTLAMSETPLQGVYGTKTYMLSLLDHIPYSGSWILLPKHPRSTSGIPHPGADQGSRYISQGLQSGQGVLAGKVRGSWSVGCILWGWMSQPGCGMKQHEKVLNLFSLLAFNTNSKDPWNSKFKTDLARRFEAIFVRLQG